MDPTIGICPSCGRRTPGWGEPCGEAGCGARGFSTVPIDWHDAAVNSARALQKPLDPLVGRSLDRYLVLCPLGKGGMGTVYAAIQRPLRREVAIKVISDLDVTPSAVARFEREANAVSSLEHPNIVRLYDYGVAQLEDAVPYMAMEYVRNGYPLGRALDAIRRKSNGVVPKAVVRAVFAQILHAVGAAHAAGIVHRDLKPDNVMIAPVHGQPLQVKVLDFGLATMVAGRECADQAAVSQAGQCIGTPTYMAPEQASGRARKTLDGRADLYAVGVMLYEIFTGTLPFKADSPLGILVQKADPAFRPLEQPAAASLPPQIASFLATALQPNPDDRFPSASAMLDALDRVLAAVSFDAPGPAVRAATPVPAAPASPAAAPEAPSEGEAAAPKRMRIPALPLGEIEALMREYLSVRTLAKDEVLFREGEQGHYMVIVLDGAMKAEMELAGWRSTVAEFGPGDVVGELTCLDPGPRTATVSATAPSRIVQIDRVGLRQLRERLPGTHVSLMGTIISQITQRIRATDARIDRLARMMSATRADSASPGAQPGGPTYVSRSAPSSVRTADFALLGQIAERRALRDGETLCREGEPGVSCYVVTRGALEVVRLVDGKATRLALLGEGSVAGQMALIDDGPRTATLKAQGEVEVLELRRDRFEQILAMRSPLALHFQELIAVNGARQLRMADRGLAAFLSRLEVGGTTSFARTTGAQGATSSFQKRAQDGGAGEKRGLFGAASRMLGALQTSLREWGVTVEEAPPP